MYKDGLSVYSRAQAGNIGNNAEQLQFCARGNTGHNSFFNGYLDEVRMSSTSRSAGWLRTEYNNQSNSTGFYTVSAEEIVDDARPLPATVLSGSEYAESYEQENPTRRNINTILVGNQAEWDFVLQNNAGAAPIPITVSVWETRMGLSSARTLSTHD